MPSTQVTLERVSDGEQDREEEEECNCGSLIDFPCWPCYRDGKRELTTGEDR